MDAQTMTETTATTEAITATAECTKAAPLPGTYPGAPSLMVTNRWEAAQWCHAYDSVLTVFAPWWHCDWGHEDHLIVEFEDRVEMELGAPTLSQVDEILTWAHARLDRTLLVHCKAGQSRSTAAAIAIACLGGLNEQQALHYVYKHCRPASKVGKRPFIPNVRFLKHVDVLLGTGLRIAAEQFVPPAERA